MFQRFALFTEFIRVFVHYALHVRELIASLLLLILIGAFVFSRIEGISFFDAAYFAFITALSIGYGEIHPTTGLGKITSVAIGLIGMLFVGLTVAVATRALADTAKRRDETVS